MMNLIVAKAKAFFGVTCLKCRTATKSIRSLWITMRDLNKTRKVMNVFSILNHAVPLSLVTEGKLPKFRGHLKCPELTL